MTQEEIRIRAVYLFLACAKAVDQLADRLAATFPSPPLSSRLLLEQILKKELGLLFRYWTTRHIWECLESQEEDAKQLNIRLLRLFTDAFRLAKDGSGLRYAGFSTPDEEVRELGHRITNALGVEHPPLLIELERSLGPSRETVLRYTTDALEQPLEQLTALVKEWAQRSPDKAS
jgi:hypothetical protein